MRNSSWYPFVLDLGKMKAMRTFKAYLVSISFFVEISPAPGLSQTGGQFSNETTFRDKLQDVVVGCFATGKRYLVL
jgi:hypothetical protein